MVVIDKREETLSFLRSKGPCLPGDVAKHINTSILIASAVLSELSSKGLVKISKLKFGSSPIYYLEGQESKLETIFYPRLNAKDKQTFDLLHKKKLLRDDELEPLLRVSLRGLGDFAIPFFVTAGDKKILFWRWYSTSESDIKDMLDLYFNKKKPPAQSKEITGAEKEKKERTHAEQSKESVGVPASKQGVLKQEVLREVKESNTLQKVKGPKARKKAISVDINFLNKVMAFFEKNDFDVLSREPKTKREVDFIVMMPTPVGKVKYFCKTWNKKRINDADLSKVAVQSQSKNLPCVLLINGSLTKKAKSMIGKEINNLIVKNI